MNWTKSTGHLSVHQPIRQILLCLAINSFTRSCYAWRSSTHSPDHVYAWRSSTHSPDPVMHGDHQPMCSSSSLNAKISWSERHSRRCNMWFLGVPEHSLNKTGRTVRLTEKLLLDRFNIGGSPIENAHRTGKAVQGLPRHVTARFYSRVTRMEVLRTARAKLSTTMVRIIDDLTQDNRQEKNHVRPFMDELYKRQ